MIVYKKTLSIQDKITDKYLSHFQDSLFFDIETTGLFWKTSHLYLIGAACFEDGVWTVHQWFLDRPGEEDRLLREFSDFCAGYRRVVHYNGDSFDIPYLQHKYSFYQIPCPLERLESLDLYGTAKSLKKMLGLSSARQKDLELFLNLSRTDTFSGGELISVYADYLRSGDQNTLAILLQHNSDDVSGLTSLPLLLGYSAIRKGDFQVTAASFDGSTLSVSLNLPDPVPVPLSCEREFYTLTLREETGLLAIPAYTGTLKHFFSDYKNYYYLPQEDQAIHKSVGAYVDSHHREKAKASNCYQKASGIFLPQTRDFFEPVFCEEYRRGPFYFLFRDALLQDMPSLYKYARQLLSP